MGLEVGGNIVAVDIEVPLVLHGGVKEVDPRFEELLNILEVLVHIFEGVFPVDDPLDEGGVVLLLGQDILHQRHGLLNLGAVRILMALVTGIQFGVVVQLGGKLLDDMGNQTVLVLGDIHLVEIVAQKLPHLADLLQADDLAP